MKFFIPLSLLAGFFASCAEHVYTHRDTSVWQSAPSSAAAADDDDGAPRSSASAAHILPEVTETVTAVQAE